MSFSNSSCCCCCCCKHFDKIFNIKIQVSRNSVDCNNQERNWTQALEFNDSITKSKIIITKACTKYESREGFTSHIMLTKCMFWNRKTMTLTVGRCENCSFSRFCLRFQRLPVWIFDFWYKKIKSREAWSRIIWQIVKCNHKTIIESFICRLNPKWFRSSRWEQTFRFEIFMNNVQTAWRMKEEEK